MVQLIQNLYHSRPNKTVAAGWFGPRLSYQKPLASVTLDPLANPWTRPFVRGTGEGAGGFCSGQIPPTRLWGRSSTLQSTAFPIHLFSLRRQSSCQALVRTAGHPQPGLGDYGFGCRAVAVFFPPLPLIRLGWAAGFVHKQEMKRELDGGGGGEELQVEFWWQHRAVPALPSPRPRCISEMKPMKLVIPDARLAEHSHTPTHPGTNSLIF